tara:strand:- start:1399 stop:1584 length:186 start_codon:yes stop_codon:yes gene_type:complete
MERGHVVIAWHTYRVEAVSATGDHHILKYKAMSPNSARYRANREGFQVTHVTRDTEQEATT